MCALAITTLPAPNVAAATPNRYDSARRPAYRKEIKRLPRAPVTDRGDRRNTSGARRVVRGRGGEGRTQKKKNNTVLARRFFVDASRVPPFPSPGHDTLSQTTYTPVRVAASCRGGGKKFPRETFTGGAIRTEGIGVGEADDVRPLSPIQMLARQSHGNHDDNYDLQLRTGLTCESLMLGRR